MGRFSNVLTAHEKLSIRKRRSAQKLQAIKDAAAGHDSLKNARLTIFAAGSLGRLETGDKSDFDVFMIADSDEYPAERIPSISRLEEYEVFAALIRINEELNYPKFSGDGRFLKTYELKELVRATGSPLDDSENLFTARMLLLLESQPITNSELYERSTAEVIAHYFRDGVGRSNFKPLFILNDILRFWRTLCLNYELARNEQRRPWLKKNLNLKFSRKLTTFSTVLCLVAKLGRDSESFSELCKMTPVERLGVALDEINDPALEPLFTKALDEYENFLAAKEASDRELDGDSALKVALSQSAERFGSFFHRALRSERIDDELRKYLLV